MRSFVRAKLGDIDFALMSACEIWGQFNSIGPNTSHNCLCSSKSCFKTSQTPVDDNEGYKKCQEKT